jgi:hypothetical protein
MGSLEWMRKWKPEIAAILDDELSRLHAAKEARKAELADRRNEAQAASGGIA